MWGLRGRCGHTNGWHIWDEGHYHAYTPKRSHWQARASTQDQAPNPNPRTTRKRNAEHYKAAASSDEEGKDPEAAERRQDGTWGRGARRALADEHALTQKPQPQPQFRPQNHNTKKQQGPRSGDEVWTWADTKGWHVWEGGGEGQYRTKKE